MYNSNEPLRLSDSFFMNTFKFLSYQFFITGLRGVTPLLLLMYFTRILSEVDLANFVALWSLGNIISGFLLMSSLTVAPQVFFESIVFTKCTLERAAYYQVFRFILFLLTTIILLFVFYVFYREYTRYLPFVLYNNLFAILPIWKYYSNRNLKNVFIVELVFKLPIILMIVLSFFFNLDVNVLILFKFLIVVGLGLVMFDILKNINLKEQKKSYWVFSLNYFKSIFQVNIIASVINSGQVYFISFFAPPILINQIAVIDKIKNLYLQLQGILISDRISKNRDFLLSSSINKKREYVKINIGTITTSLIVFVIIYIVSFFNLFDLIFNVLIENYIVFTLLMVNVFTSGLVIIFISHIFNSYGKINEFKKVYVKAFFSALLVSLLLFKIVSYYSIVSFGLLFDIMILIVGYRLGRRLFFLKNE